jgi:hypothetical protein
MLKGVHCSRINIDIRVEFLEGDGQAAAFKKGTDGRGCQSFAKGGEHAARHKNKLGSFGGILSFHGEYYSKGASLLKEKRLP